jgi:hypothetical protein
MIPLAIFMAFAAFYVIISLASGSDVLFRPVWDIGHYLSIAERGYEVYPCDPEIHWPIGEICGNVGWYPAWPVAVKILSIGQVSFGIRFLPFLFGLLGFILFYQLVLRLADTRAAIIATIALASTPTAFYYLTGFPYSFILTLFVVYLLYLYNDRAWGRLYILPIIAVLISLTYPSAILTAIIPLVMLVDSYRRKVRKPSVSRIVKDILYYLVPFAVGPLLLSLYFYFTFDDFLLILHFQEKYHRSWAFPLTVIWNSMLQFPALYVENASVLFYGLILLIFTRYRLKPELIAFLLLFFFFSPATGSITSVYRHYILLFPAAIIIGTSERPLWIKIVYMALGLALSIFRMYPIFMDGRLI